MGGEMEKREPREIRRGKRFFCLEHAQAMHGQSFERTKYDTSSEWEESQPVAPVVGKLTRAELIAQKRKIYDEECIRLGGPFNPITDDVADMLSEVESIADSDISSAQSIDGISNHKKSREEIIAQNRAKYDKECVALGGPFNPIKESVTNRLSEVQHHQSDDDFSNIDHDKTSIPGNEPVVEAETDANAVNLRGNMHGLPSQSTPNNSRMIPVMTLDESSIMVMDGCNKDVFMDSRVNESARRFLLKEHYSVEDMEVDTSSYYKPAAKPSEKRQEHAKNSMERPIKNVFPIRHAVAPVLPPNNVVAVNKITLKASPVVETRNQSINNSNSSFNLPSKRLQLTPGYQGKNDRGEKNAFYDRLSTPKHQCQRHSDLITSRVATKAPTFITPVKKVVSLLASPLPDGKTVRVYRTKKLLDDSRKDIPKIPDLTALTIRDTDKSNEGSARLADFSEKDRMASTRLSKEANVPLLRDDDGDDSFDDGNKTLDASPTKSSTSANRNKRTSLNVSGVTADFSRDSGLDATIVHVHLMQVKDDEPEFLTIVPPKIGTSQPSSRYPKRNTVRRLNRALGEEPIYEMSPTSKTWTLVGVKPGRVTEKVFVKNRVATSEELVAKQELDAKHRKARKEVYAKARRARAVLEDGDE